MSLPRRQTKPRRAGLTVVIDGGSPTGRFQDAIWSAADLVDLVKFGWGTALVTADLDRKIQVLRRAGVDFYFGGTLFEKCVVQGRVDDFRRFCHEHESRYVEVSNGTIDLTNRAKAAYIRELSREFTVLSEVGFKDQSRSQGLTPDLWIEYIHEDLTAGAALVLTEARESGRSGICEPNGELRQELIEEILGSGLDPARIVFEAPNKDLQAYFVSRLGPDVNLGNVGLDDVIGLETLRLGLRADTLLCWE